MKKLFMTVLIMAMAVSSIAFAGYSEEYKAKHPGTVTTKTEQDLSGKMVTTTRYSVFWHNNFQLVVEKTADYSYAFIRYTYFNKDLMLYDGFTWGDGNQVYDLKLFIDPVRNVNNGMVYEMIMAAVDLNELKKAVIIHAHSHQHGHQVMISSSDPKWDQWKTALEDAEKILNDK